jgi:hypothetical protein
MSSISFTIVLWLLTLSFPIKLTKIGLQFDHIREKKKKDEKKLHCGNPQYNEFVSIIFCPCLLVYTRSLAYDTLWVGIIFFK